MSGTAAAHDDPPRRRVVRDPVHDYVEIPGELEPLVASAALQRLRNISQNGRANRRYPSLTGSRYEHALGTMHLARAGWQSAWRTCEEDVRQRFAREVVTELRAREPIVPLRLYINPKGRAKIELGLARGKQLHDRRRDIARQDARRDVERELADVQRGR